MKHKKIFSEYWMKHYTDKSFTGLCELCGNTGIIETSPKSPRGIPIGTFKNYCICPNGRAKRGE
jgi:hypothetical protein